MSKRKSTDLWRTNIMGDAPASCKGCAYLDSRRCCNYSGVTGRTRLGKIAQIMGTQEGREWKLAIKCENCTLWEPGKKGAKRLAQPMAKVVFDEENRLWFSKLQPNVARALVRAGWDDNRICRTMRWNPKDMARWHAYYPNERESTEEIDAPRGVGKPQQIDKDEIAELYERGMSDQEIANRVGCCKRTVELWRHENGLPPVFMAADPSRIVGEWKLMKFYRQGMVDADIAEAAGYDIATVLAWRKRNGLEPNFKRALQIQKALIELYRVGLNDVEIGKICGMSREKVRYWRKARDLPTNVRRNNEDC